MYNVYSHPLRRFIRRVVFYAGLLCIVFGALQNHQTENTERTLWIVDNSLSMHVRDVSEESKTSFVSRLETAKKLIQATSTKDPRAHGLITFARTPFLQTPFSANTLHIHNVVAGVSPIIYGGGSDLLRALQFTSDIYTKNPDFRVVIITDGEVGDTEAIKNINFLPASAWVIGIGSVQG